MPERQYVKSLNPYSRMALAARGWGLEVVLALGVFVLWRLWRITLSTARRLGDPGPRDRSASSSWRSAHASRPARLATTRWAGDRATPAGGSVRVLIACELISRHGLIPRIESTEAIPAGQRLRLRLPPGLTAEIIEEASEALAATIGARDVRVVRDPANASVAHVSILLRDPLSSPAPAWPLPKGSRWEPLSLGVDEDGNRVSIGLPERNLLLGGEPGAGKSVALSLFIAAAALDPSVTLTLLDGKQVELAPWSGSAEHFVGPDMAGAIEVLKDLCAEMDRRYSVLLSSGLRKIEPGGRFGLHVVAIDELAFYMRGGTKDERAELSETLRDLISRGRAAGMIVIAATQKPSNDIVPTFVRDLFSFRMALRCTTPEASDTILGQGWAKEGYSASTLDPTSRGVGYLLAEGAVPVKIRSHYLDDDAIADLAQRAARRAPTSGGHSEVGRRVARRAGRGRPGRPVRPPGPPAGPHLGPLEWRAHSRGDLLVACKDRRAAVCPSCARLYQADAWHLVAAGIRGGKGVPPSVVAHPQLFVTLTAPSFGPVHRSAPAPGDARRLPTPAERQALPARSVALVHPPPRRRRPCRRRAVVPRVLRLPRRGAVERPRPAAVEPDLSPPLPRGGPGAGVSTRALRSVAGCPTSKWSSSRPEGSSTSTSCSEPTAGPGRASRRRRGSTPQSSSEAVGRSSPRPACRCPTSRERRCAGLAGAPSTTSVCSSPTRRLTPRPSPPTWPSTPPRRRMGRRGWRIGSGPGPRWSASHCGPTSGPW